MEREHQAEGSRMPKFVQKVEESKVGICIFMPPNGILWQLFLVRRDESPENYCHSPGVVVVVVVVRRQKL